MPHLLSYMVAETMGADILSEGIIRNNRCKAVGKCLGMGAMARASRVIAPLVAARLLGVVLSGEFQQ